jgi:hypothetical protein
LRIFSIERIPKELSGQRDLWGSFRSKGSLRMFSIERDPQGSFSLYRDPWGYLTCRHPQWYFRFRGSTGIFQCEGVLGGHKNPKFMNKPFSTKMFSSPSQTSRLAQGRPATRREERPPQVLAGGQAQVRLRDPGGAHHRRRPVRGRRERQKGRNQGRLLAQRLHPGRFMNLRQLICKCTPWATNNSCANFHIFPFFCLLKELKPSLSDTGNFLWFSYEPPTSQILLTFFFNLVLRA